MNSTCCPDCSSTRTKRNGHLPNGKQNHLCLDYFRQFVQHPENKIITEDEKCLVKKLWHGSNQGNTFFPTKTSNLLKLSLIAC